MALEVRKCEECARYHRGNAPKQTLLNPFHAGEPLEVISIDITGRHPKSRRGNEYIVTVVDLFTRWAEAIPVRNHTAEVVARVLLDRVINRFGTPFGFFRIKAKSSNRPYSGNFVRGWKSTRSGQVPTNPPQTAWWNASTELLIACWLRSSPITNATGVKGWNL